MRRGMTMVEIVLALSLLTMVAVAVASWTQIAARAAAGASGPGRWRAAAEGVLQLIHEDLSGGDLQAPRGDPRVRVVDGMLEIRTRANATGGLIGPVVCRYRHEPATGHLFLEQRSPGGTRRSRLLLDSLRQWDVSIDDKKQTLGVTIGSADSTVHRSFVLR